MTTTIGIIGAGRVGLMLARLAQAAGFRVLVAGSGEPVRSARVVSMFAPGAETVWASEAAAADLVVLSIPLGVFDELSPIDLAGAVAIDAMNYWPEADGERADLDTGEPTSMIVQRHLPEATIVKSLNHVSFRDMESRATGAGTPYRVAVAIAGDDESAVAKVRAFIDAIGFDTVSVGSLANSAVMEPRGEIFGAVLGADGLRARLGTDARD